MESSAKWEARTPTVGGDNQVGAVRQRPALPGAKDPFRLGFRERTSTTHDGRQVLEQLPLTYEDLVYPQERDHVSQGLPHFSFLHPQADAMRCYLEKRPGITVTSDVTLVLRHDGKNCAPYVAVIEGSFATSEIEGGVNLGAVGGRLAFAFEAVSASADRPEVGFPGPRCQSGRGIVDRFPAVLGRVEDAHLPDQGLRHAARSVSKAVKRTWRPERGKLWLALESTRTA